MNKNSMCYWWDKVKDLDIPMPETAIVPFTKKTQKAYCRLDEPNMVNEGMVDILKTKIKEYPVFIRTDQSSAKHSWKNACFIENEDRLRQNLFNILEFNLLADILGLPAEAFVVRRYIEMEKSFLAFQDMPVNPERRYFIKDGQVLCHHAYWIQEAIEKGYHATELPDNWEALLKAVNREEAGEIQLLTKYASEIATKFEGFWSVDFCKSIDGKWYFIDMATGKDSWHPEDCEHSQITETI